MKLRVGELVARMIPPSAAIEDSYAGKLQELVEAMADSMLLHILAAWRENTPAVGFASDTKSSAVRNLERCLAKWGKRWQKKISGMAEPIAVSFAFQTRRDFDARFARVCRDAGFTVRFQPTREMREAFRAVVAENVNLIRSIPQKFLTDVQSAVWESVMKGNKTAELSRSIKKSYGVAWRRAALIARDQTHKAKAIMEEARRSEVGIEEAVWVHSGAGREKREEHVRWSRERRRYKIKRGMWSHKDQAWVWPGTPINCRCGSRSVFPELGPRQGAVNLR